MLYIHRYNLCSGCLTTRNGKTRTPRFATADAQLLATCVSRRPHCGHMQALARKRIAAEGASFVQAARPRARDSQKPICRPQLNKSLHEPRLVRQHLHKCVPQSSQEKQSTTLTANAPLCCAHEATPAAAAAAAEE